MVKELRNERFLRIYFNDGRELLVDINNDTQWENIMKEKEKIINVSTLEWTWNLLNGNVVFQ